MGAAAGDVPDALRLERLDEARLVAGEARAVAQLAVVALAPAVHLALHRERQAVLPAGVDGNLQCRGVQFYSFDCSFSHSSKVASVLMP